MDVIVLTITACMLCMDHSGGRDRMNYWCSLYGQNEVSLNEVATRR